jgi:hypothetical protein
VHSFVGKFFKSCTGWEFRFYGNFLEKFIILYRMRGGGTNETEGRSFGEFMRNIMETIKTSRCGSVEDWMRRIFSEDGLNGW